MKKEYHFNQYQCNECSIIIGENDDVCPYPTHSNCKLKSVKSFDTLDETLTYVLVEFGPHMVNQFGFKVDTIKATFKSK